MKNKQYKLISYNNTIEPIYSTYGNTEHWNASLAIVIHFCKTFCKWSFQFKCPFSHRNYFMIMHIIICFFLCLMLHVNEFFDLNDRKGQKTRQFNSFSWDVVNTFCFVVIMWLRTRLQTKSNIGLLKTSIDVVTN